MFDYPYIEKLLHTIDEKIDGKVFNISLEENTQNYTDVFYRNFLNDTIKEVYISFEENGKPLLKVAEHPRALITLYNRYKNYPINSPMPNVLVLSLEYKDKSKIDLRIYKDFNAIDPIKSIVDKLNE